MGKILRIDLSTDTITENFLQEHTARQFLGGSGLGAKILSDETGPETDPLGPENIMIFAAGPLNGTGLFNSNRFDVVSKSPLTGIFAESSAGGYWGGKFKACGYDALVISGASSKPVYISITDTSVEIKDAGFIWGKDTFESTGETYRKRGQRSQSGGDW